MTSQLNKHLPQISPERVLADLPESIFWKDINGVYLGCTNFFVQIAGVASREDIIGKTDYDLLWRDYANMIHRNDRLVIESGATHVFEEEGIRANSEKILVRTIKTPMRNEAGEVIGIIGVSSNITDLSTSQKKLIDQLAAYEAIKKTESAYLRQWYEETAGQKVSEAVSAEVVGNKLRTYIESIIDKLPANLFWMDLKGKILGANTEMSKVVGHQTRQEIIGKNIADFVPDDVVDMVHENNAQVIRDDKIIAFEERVKLEREGEEAVFLSYKVPLKDDEDKPIGLMGVSFNITDRKRMEQELKRAKEEAEAANLAKIHFLNNMRHDIRTPLSCVVGSARILKQMEADPDKLEFIEGILKSSESLLQMMTNMLEYSMTENTERKVELKPVHVQALLKDLCDMLSLTVKQKGLALNLTIDPETPPSIISDHYRLQRVLLNLLNNAIKFTNTGDVTVDVKPDEKAKRLWIKVIDTGIGIPEKQQQIIFEKFVRLVDADKGLYQGEGLGLSIVKQFVEELGGTLEVQSALGQGSTFLLSLPYAYTKLMGEKEVQDAGVVS